MGYRTTNDETHECDYCGNLVEVGQGVLLKYSEAQPDEEIILRHLTNRIGHIPCVRKHGSRIDKLALKGV